MLKVRRFCCPRWRPLLVGVWLLLCGSRSFAQPTVYFSEDFNSYLNDTEVQAAGWTLALVGGATSGGWTLGPVVGDSYISESNPPKANGTPTTGAYMLAHYGGNDPVGSGASRDLITPSIDCSGSTTVWLHTDVSLKLNDGGAVVGLVDVSNDNGATWNTVFQRSGFARSDNGYTTYLEDNTNTGDFYGRLDLDISAYAAGQSDVKIRYRYFEQNDDWWFFVDNVVVDDQPLVAGTDATLFAWDFGDGTLGPMTVTGLQSGDNTWTTADPGSRWFPNDVGAENVNRINHVGPGQTGANYNFAIVDATVPGSVDKDEYLMTPTIDCTGYEEIVLEFESECLLEQENTAVEVLVSIDGGTTWLTPSLFAYTGGGATVAFDIGGWTYDGAFYAERAFRIPQAANQPDLRLAWRMAHPAATAGGFWAVDSIKVTANVVSTVPLDSDGDGLNNDDEVTYGTDPANPDSDGDGLLDGDEVYLYGTNPAEQDTDSDGLSDAEEINVYGSNPNATDTDGDALEDNVEVSVHGTDPARPDTDFDGYDDGEEVSLGTSPTNMLDYPGSTIAYLFYDGFDAYRVGADMEAAGWQRALAAQRPSMLHWDIGPGVADVVLNPPTVDGSESTGRCAFSLYGPASDPDPPNSGASRDLVTPSIDCSSASTVWLHVDVVAHLNGNGTTVFIIDVSNDDGVTWNEAFLRVANNRSEQGYPDDDAPTDYYTTYLETFDNTNGYFGRLDVDLTPFAAGQSNVKVRFRNYEEHSDWFIAIDNVLVDENPVVPGSVTVFSEDFNAQDGTLGQMTAMSSVSPPKTGTATWSTIHESYYWEDGSGWIGDTYVNRLGHPVPLGPNDELPFAMINSAFADNGPDDEYLMTPPLDLTAYDRIRLGFKDEFRPWQYEDAVEVLYSLDGGATWEQPLFNYFGGGLILRNEENFYGERLFEVPAAAGRSNVVFAFHYKTPGYHWWWAVDDVEVTAEPLNASADNDGDGLTNGEEVALETNLNDADTDGDGLGDGEEVNTHLTDPLQVDSDYDGLDDWSEVNTHGTNPNSADSDADGVLDGVELAAGTDPLNPLDSPFVPAASLAGLAAAAAALALAGGVTMRRTGTRRQD